MHELLSIARLLSILHDTATSAFRLFDSDELMIVHNCKGGLCWHDWLVLIQLKLLIDNDRRVQDNLVICRIREQLSACVDLASRKRQSLLLGALIFERLLASFELFGANLLVEDVIQVEIASSSIGCFGRWLASMA